MRLSLLTVLLLLLLAPGAQAAALVHLDDTGNVRVTSADGTLQRQVTSDGSAQAPYTAPVADDAGVILTYGHPDAFTARLLGTDGTDARGPFALPASPCSAGPQSAAITPDGSLIAAAWTDGRRGCTVEDRHRRHHHTTTSILHGDAPTAPVNAPGAPLPSFRGHRAPRWIGASTPRLAAIRHDAIDVQVAGGVDAPLERWLGVPHHEADLDSFDLNRAGDLLLLETSADGRPSGGEDRRLEVRRVTGTPPQATTTLVCTLDTFVTGAPRPALPRWSPDGTMIAWSEPSGVVVSPAPVAGADGTCVLDPQLVAPGGRDAAWTAADLPAPVVEPPVETEVRTTAPPSTIRRVTGTPQVTPAARIVVNVTLQSARTIRIRVERLPAAGRRGRARLVGTVRYSGRAGRNAVAIATVAGRGLPDGRYRLTISAFRHRPKALIVTVGG